MQSTQKNQCVIEGAKTKRALELESELNQAWFRQLVADQIAGSLNRALKEVTKDLRKVMVNQVDELLRQEAGNIARSRGKSRPRHQDPSFYLSGERLVRAEEFQFRAGIRPTTFFELQRKDGPDFDETFPRKVLINPRGRAVGYIESQVQFWIQQRPNKAKERKNDRNKSVNR